MAAVGGMPLWLHLRLDLGGALGEPLKLAEESWVGTQEALRDNSA